MIPMKTLERSGLSMKVSALSRASWAHYCLHSKERAISLKLEKRCHRRPRLAANLCGWNSVRPSHLFGRYLDHDYYFELPCGSGAPNHFDRDLRHTIAQLRATPRANRLQSLLIIPCFAPHPIMGFTPLEGLMMGTRSGSVDPGILTYLVRQRHLSGQQLDEILNQKAISYSLQESAKTHPKFALRCVKVLRSLT